MESLPQQKRGKRGNPALQNLKRKLGRQLFRSASVLLVPVAALIIQPDKSFGQGRSAGAEETKAIDVVVFGDKDSESAHDLAAETSRIIEGKDDTPARQIMESEPDDGVGSMSFTMECHPSERTYFTLKLEALPDDWSEVMLFHGDDMVGYDALRGLWPPVNYMSRFRNAKHSEWWYATIRLPMFMTEGKEKVDIRLVNWDRRTKGPTEPLYRAYTHTQPMFDLPDDETGATDFDLGKVAGPPEKPYGDMIESINETVRTMRLRKPHREIHGLAMAYSRGDWIDTVDQERILEKVKRSIDGLARKQVNADSPGDLFRGWRAWEEHGCYARAYSLLHRPFEEKGLLSETLKNHPENGVTRREAYTKFFHDALWWRARERKDIYNQFIIITLGMVRMHEALEKLDPERYPATVADWVSPETIERMVPRPDPDDPVVDRWIDEAIGLAGVTNPDNARRHFYFFRDGSYRIASEAGIGKEMGWSVSYSSVCMQHTAELAIETGLERVKERVAKMARAMAAMSWWVQDAETGLRDSAVDGVLSHRQNVYPGDRAPGFGATPMLNFLAVGDEATQAWAEASLEHGHVKAAGWPPLPGYIHSVEGFRKLRERESSDYVLGIDRKRYVWSDEDLGIVVMVDGDTHIKTQLGYGGMSMAHEWGVSEAARVHYHGPKGSRVITTDMDRVEFPFAGDIWERPNNLQHAGPTWNRTITKYLPWRGERVQIDQALAGQKLRQASKPNGDPWPGADRSKPRNMRSPDPRVGQGVHYRQVWVADYLIGMNSTGARERGFGPGKEYEMEVPEGTIIDVATGEEVTGETVTVPPRTTKVLKRQAK